jgi:UDP-2,4-diacetamido-2,4,6-trideoxy-beta-L-altropyranose hydrolase
MRVIFRVDASLQIGTGHVMRCLTLAKVLKENGANVDFICRQHDGNLISKIQSNGFNVFELTFLTESKVDDKLSHSHWLGVTQQQDVIECFNILKETKVDWLIVDHYGIDEDWQKLFKPRYNKLMVIDDLADRYHQCDLLLDQTFGRQQDDYKALVPTNCELLLGPQYALLRPDFSKWRLYSLERRSHSKFKQLLINMGGVDADNVTGKVLKKLKVCNLPHDISIIVVMGASAPHLENVKDIVCTLPYVTTVKVDVDNMAEIMANSDIAIGASGATSWERCCLGLPSIQIVLAKNQQMIAKLLANKEAIRLLQDIEELPNLLENAVSWMKNTSNISQQISNGKGSLKVLGKIVSI